ncbi:MAG: tRNA-(ms[2]io[6]A)-hydroxylase [Gammaproteobacteria bacterium]|nr:tRNA-(ms[2]io[6]A)-hydroxylase [Gammaproteobacteria bacterium]
MTPAVFLRCPTPDAWLEAVVPNLETLLIDHANCEKKAAGTALSLMYRYIDQERLLMRLSKLAREELRHFEQVLSVMKARGVKYRHVTPCRYAGMLRGPVRTHEPARLIDTLIVGAIVEARSCERFAAMAPRLDADLAEFYQGLEASEARHFDVYLSFARTHSTGVSAAQLESRIDFFLELEASLIQGSDPDFRFHSGVPG